MFLKLYIYFNQYQKLNTRKKLFFFFLQLSSLNPFVFTFLSSISQQEKVFLPRFEGNLCNSVDNRTNLILKFQYLKIFMGKKKEKNTSNHFHFKLNVLISQLIRFDQKIASNNQHCIHIYRHRHRHTDNKYTLYRCFIIFNVCLL